MILCRYLSKYRHIVIKIDVIINNAEIVCVEGKNDDHNLLATCDSKMYNTL